MKLKVILGLVVALVLASSYWRYTNLDRVLGNYGDSSSFGEGSQAITIPSPEEAQRSRYFRQLWKERRKLDVIGEMIPYLIPASPSLNADYEAKSTLQWLSESESPQSLPALRALSRQYRSSYGGPLNRAAIDITIGRIESRQLKGQDRMNALAKSVGLSWSDVIKLSRRVYIIDPTGRIVPNYHRPAASAIYNTFIETLYSMGKKGENITPLANQLRLGSYPRLRISCAMVSPEKEVTLIFTYLDNAKAITAQDEKISGDLIALGKTAEDRIIQRLQLMVENPTQYRSGRGYVILFKVARSLNASRTKPLFEKLSHDKNSWVSHYASF